MADHPAAPAKVLTPILLSLFSAESVPPFIISAASRSVASPPPITEPPAAPAKTVLPVLAIAAFHATPPSA